MKVVFTPISQNNPYQRQLAAVLEKNGVNVAFSIMFPKLVWLWKNRLEVKIIHIHWPTGLYRMGKLTHLRAVVLIFRILWARFLGYRLVWTVHNLLPHESTPGGWDVFFRRVLVKYCAGIIGHFPKALLEIQDSFGPPRNGVVIPHGNFNGCYPSPPQRSVARKLLGLPIEGFVLLCFGQIRGYKGLVEMIRQFRRFEAGATLVIAGKGAPNEIEALKNEADDADVRFFCEFIPDEELPTYFAAADGVVTPYLQIFTSGAAILALSMGVPVVAPALGGLPELLSDDSGIIYDPDEPDGLCKALYKLRNSDLGHMSRQAMMRAEQLDWGAIGQQTFHFYRQIADVRLD